MPVNKETKPKVSGITQLEFELTYFETAVQNFWHEESLKKKNITACRSDLNGGWCTRTIPCFTKKVLNIIWF